MLRIALVFFLFCSIACADSLSPDLSGLATSAQVQAAQSAAAAAQAAVPSNAAIAALAPVQAVNTKVGQVSVPTLCRQQSAATPIPTTNPGAVTWTFPNTACSFASTPSCWSDIATSSTGWVFDYPMKTAGSTTAVTYAFTAHATTLTISLGSLSLSVGPPANSTVILTCTAPPA